MTEKNGSSRVNRRNVLKLASAAAVGSIGVTGAGSATRGNKKGGGGRGRGTPFLEPTEDGKVVNFCGCSSVCIGNLPHCSWATIVYKDGDTETVRDRNCYDRDGIAKVTNELNDGTVVTYCNPNTACSGNTESECTGENTEVGTAPQLEGGRGCGD